MCANELGHYGKYAIWCQLIANWNSNKDTVVLYVLENICWQTTGLDSSHECCARVIIKQSWI